jgi:hypothetical protein
MDIIDYDDSARFLERAAPVLGRNEAFTGLIYGIADRVGRIADLDPDEPFMASVEEGGQVRLIAVMTPPHRVILHSSRDMPERDVLCALANHLRSASRPIPGVLGPRPLAEAFADVWTKLSGQRTSQGLVMTVYELRRIRDPGNASGTYRHATDADRDLLETWVDAFHWEIHRRAPLGQEAGAVSRRLANGDYRIWEHGGESGVLCRPVPPDADGDGHQRRLHP